MDHRGVGASVASVGLRHGRHLAGIAALLDAGFRVVAFDLGNLDEDPLEPDLQTQLDGLLARHVERLAVVDSLEGVRVADALVASETAVHELLAETDRRFGTTRCVYAGQWWGIVDYALGAAFIRVLAERGGGEFIATEADATVADEVIRWTALWAMEPWAAGVECIVLREPPGGRRPTISPAPDTKVWRTLCAAAWSGPLSISGADEVAATRRADGTDLFAGRMWEYLGAGDVDSGSILTGDADAVALKLRAGAELSAGLSRDTMRADDGYVLFCTPDGDSPYGIEVTPPGGPIEAVRLALDADAYEFPDPYERMTVIDVSSGRLTISDPAYLDRAAQWTLDVVPGDWLIECLSHDGDLEGVRLRRIGESRKAYS